MKSKGKYDKSDLLRALDHLYMSPSTSIFGVLPLVLFPGAGSELSRGLGSVILGRLAVSTIFTVFVIPSILMFFIKREKVRKTDT